MTVNINYWWLSATAIGVVVLIVWLIKCNNKDKKALEKEIIDADLKPEKHDNDEDETIRR